MTLHPEIDCPMIVSLLTAALIGLFQVGLSEPPTAILASFHRDLHEIIRFCNDQIVFRLICAVLHRHIKSAPGKLSSGKCLGGYGNMP